MIREIKTNNMREEKIPKMRRVKKKKKNIIKRRRKRRYSFLRSRFKIMAIVFFAVVLVSVVLLMPKICSNYHCLKAAKKLRQEEYREAIVCYNKALECHATSSKTYQSMAKAYLSMDNYQAAGDILKKGMEVTKDDNIKEYYITVLLNESINDMNQGKCSWETLEDVITVLNTDSLNSDAYEVLDSFYKKNISCKDGDLIKRLFMQDDNYEKYNSFITELIDIYQKNPSDMLKNQIYQYAFLDCETVNLPVDKLESYRKLLEKVLLQTGTEDEMEWIDALKKAEEIHDFFTPILREFEKENFEIARDFIVSDDYIGIRDAFINGEMKYWEDTTYQVVSDIAVSFHLADGKRTFSFMDEDPKEAKHGFIKVWGFRWVDNGHLRTGISYVPAKDYGEDDEFREYEIMYWWSTAKNIAIAESTYAKMNYRFEIRHYTNEGMYSEVINDWGGPYEYKDTYE